MHNHQFSNLYLHDEDELALIIQEEIIERTTLHEWPLSCVQRLIGSSGRKWIYKSQFGPTVEADFYDRFAYQAAGLMVSAKKIYQSGQHSCMLIEHIDHPRMSEVLLTESEVLQIGNEVILQIASLFPLVENVDFQLPFLMDIRSLKGWEQQIDTLLRELSRLIHQDQFRLVNRELTRRLETWALSSDILTALQINPGLVHGDLVGENLFILPDGYRVIDWQRPMLGPTGIDLATLIESTGHDPSKYVNGSLLQILTILRVHWFVQCATRWFPQGVEDYDRLTMKLLSGLPR